MVLAIAFGFGFDFCSVESRKYVDSMLRVDGLWWVQVGSGGWVGLGGFGWEGGFRFCRVRLKLKISQS